ncbi:phosphotransferase family protein [Paenibacillus montanisoli]|uniref:Aminoglycoside phosphotransferase family protein n=1 Tax=Paenibacillus montanisoli TaxID=2081970 RepID=A0A328U7I4_9BACL|nr:aminoglycoside phosphotransferase family protein [Paenibacillus montanisoli]RAP76054.1 aminoglycoside phosphotransferase family protein [Paenibacillus montanisoli]
MNLQENETKVTQWAERNAAVLGLSGSPITVSYIYNPGGFVNQSYRISDGITSRHLKLAPSAKIPRLRQWARVSKLLEDRCRAPKLICEIEDEIIPEYRYGLAFDFIPGTQLSNAAAPDSAVLQVLDTLRQLHGDRELAIALEEGVPTALTCADAFVDAYINRFEEDMKSIRTGKQLLDFVTDETLDWFDAEIDSLKKTVLNHPAFQQRARDVVHNDIGWNNVLLGEQGGVGIIDWDDLSANGDAAMDYSVLLWPYHNKPEWTFWQEKVRSLAGDELNDRLSLYFRAKLLDDVIDILADYVESEHIPELKEITQSRARAIHLKAYPEYVQLYG